jgi:hypothetical protein
MRGIHGVCDRRRIYARFFYWKPMGRDKVGSERVDES